MFSGISGNMILGACIDAGISEARLLEALGALPLGGYEIRIEKVKKMGIAATYVDIRTDEVHPHRHLLEIQDIIKQAGYPHGVEELALSVFNRLAEAEAKIHATTVDKIHFHEVGAVDAILDIVGAAWCLHELGITRVYGSPVHLGSGMIRCDHGMMPIPAPATQELLKGVHTYSGDIKGELTTPTGAAIISALAESFGPQPDIIAETVAYGAGTWDLSIPNVLRLVIGTEPAGMQGILRGKGRAGEIGSGLPADVIGVKGIFKRERAYLLETQLDDMQPELFTGFMEKILDEGALDVYYTPVYMKKNRPGILLTILAPDEPAALSLAEITVRETTAIGIRIRETERLVLEREMEVVQTSLGPVRVKRVFTGETTLGRKAEIEDCLAISRETGHSLKEVYGIILKEIGV